MATIRRSLLLGFVYAAILSVLGCGSANPLTDIPPTQPKVAKLALSGCHREIDTAETDDKTYPYCGDASLELTVETGALHVLHRNVAYNCCVDEVTITAVLEGDTLILTEQETTTMPCRCMCCYDVEATITNLAAGTYTVEFCSVDPAVGGLACETQTIVIP